MSTKPRDTLVKNALILAVGGFIAKAIGAVYRIPLTNLLGGEGMGIYQMVFPLYCMMLTLSSTGVPAGLSRLIAGKDEAEGRRLFVSARRLMLLVGLLGSGLMAALSGFLATSQGAPLAAKAYLALAPSVVVVSVISCYRGYQQGKMKMFPTALSQMIEQSCKLLFGLLLARAFMPDVALAAAGAALGVTISEVVALVYLSLRWRRQPKISVPLVAFRADSLQIAKIVLPVTLSSLLLPLSHLIDSFMVVNLLSRYTAEATTLYGLFSGAVTSVVNLPVALAYGVAAAVIPVLSVRAAKGDQAAVQNQTLLAVGLTVFIALPCAVFLAVLGGDAVGILYGGLGEIERETVVGLLRVSSISVVFLSLTQTLSAALVGQGKPYVPVLTLSVGVAVKTAVLAVTLQMPKFSIYGAAISTNLCYLVAGTGNLVYSIKGGKTVVALLGCVLAALLVSGAAVFAASLLRVGGVIGSVVRTLTAATIVGGLLSVGFFALRRRKITSQKDKADKI